MSKDHPKLYPVSLGCAKNRVDTEIMLALLTQAGWDITPDPEAADLLLVNTCAFIASATQEAIDTLLELAPLKQARPNTLLVATGCLISRYGPDLPDLLPEVDAFIGVNDFTRIVQIVAALQAGDGPQREYTGEPLPWNVVMPRVLTTPPYTAYLKIAEGCHHRCTYCTIPGIRGPLRSRPLEVLLEEAAALLARGVVEINLVAQDTTAYGLDFAQGPRLPELLARLAGLPGLTWLRLLYSHPTAISAELLEVMAAHPKICPYLDIPVQHLSDRLLQRMGRRYTQAQVHDTLARIRDRLPGAAIRTSLITGFPGETEADFDALCRGVEELAFDHLGVFAYEPEEGTPASRLPDQLPPKIRRQRARRLQQLAAKLARQRWRRLKGTVQEVLIEGVSPETDLLLTGRLAIQAPEVDGQVYITAGVGHIGRIQPVRLTHSHTHDLVGELLVQEP